MATTRQAPVIENRRRAPRVSVAVRVSGTIGPDVPLAMGKSRDLSMTGMYVELLFTAQKERHPRLAKGEKVRLRFRLPTSETPTEVDATVARLALDEAGIPCGAGVDFGSLEGESKAQIQRFLAATLENDL